MWFWGVQIEWLMNAGFDTWHHSSASRAHFHIVPSIPWIWFCEEHGSMLENQLRPSEITWEIHLNWHFNGQIIYYWRPCLIPGGYLMVFSIIFSQLERNNSPIFSSERPGKSSSTMRLWIAYFQVSFSPCLDAIYLMIPYNFHVSNCSNYPFRKRYTMWQSRLLQPLSIKNMMFHKIKKIKSCASHMVFRKHDQHLAVQTEVQTIVYSLNHVLPQPMQLPGGFHPRHLPGVQRVKLLRSTNPQTWCDRFDQWPAGVAGARDLQKSKGDTSELAVYSRNDCSTWSIQYTKHVFIPEVSCKVATEIKKMKN